MAQQADALARDPLAAGAALYTDEGRPAPIDDTAARIRQARIVADRTGLPVPPYSTPEIADMRRILTDGPPEQRAAVLARYEALPDDMKAALKPRLLPAQAQAEPAPAGEGGATFRIAGLYAADGAQASSAVPATAPAGGQGMAPPTEPPPGSPEYQAAEAETRRIASVPEGQPSAPRGASLAVAAAPAAAASGSVLGEIGQAASQAAKGAAGWVGRAAPAAAGAVAGAIPLILTPTNTQAELHPLGEGLRVRTAPGQRSATVQRRVDDGLFGTGIGATWTGLPVKAEWSTRGPNRQRVIAIDRQGLEQVIGRDAADAALGGNGIAMAKPPSKDGPAERDEPGPGHNSEAFGEKLGPEDKDPRQNPPQGVPPVSNQHSTVPDGGPDSADYGFTYQWASKDLDPAKLNRRLSRAEQQRIGDTLARIKKGDVKGLHLHEYGNVPHPETGAILPASGKGYLAVDVPSVGSSARGTALLIDKSTGRFYYSNTHYKSFYPIKPNPKAN